MKIKIASHNIGIAFVVAWNTLERCHMIIALILLSKKYLLNEYRRVWPDTAYKLEYDCE